MFLVPGITVDPTGRPWDMIGTFLAVFLVRATCSYSINLSFDLRRGPLRGRFHSVSKSWLGLTTWAKQAYYPDDGANNALIISDASLSIQQQDVTYRMATPREWLEYCPDGAYTVMRCDYRALTNIWIRWGQQFHSQRLEKSYHCYLQAEAIPIAPEEMQLVIEQALSKTRYVIDRLLEEADHELANQMPPPTSASNPIVVFMVTLLWHPSTPVVAAADSMKHSIPVKGHITSSLTWLADPREYNPSPAKIVLGLATDDTLIPNSWAENRRLQQDPPRRHDSFPQAKLSAWCRQRRPWESQLKLPGCFGEVILTLVDARGDTLLLEGLTSNLFVVLPGHELQTAGSSYVLSGYARQCVMEQAPDLGYPVVTDTPPRLNNCDRWQEVFVTSSVRLITPVSAIFIPSSSGSPTKEGTTALEFKEIWRWNQTQTATTPVWQAIYQSILQSQYSKYSG